MKTGRIILLTGVSGSGKTTIQEELRRRGWKIPINFSTRTARGDYELDNYVFLPRELFLMKLNNGDFIEYTQYGGNFYGIATSFLYDKDRTTSNYAIVVDPIGRSSIQERLSELGIKYECYFIDITPEIQYDRLSARGDTKEQIEKRRNDFNWFYPSPDSKIINGDQPTYMIIDRILGAN